jgi:hypothetical protein
MHFNTHKGYIKLLAVQGLLAAFSNTTLHLELLVFKFIAAVVALSLLEVACGTNHALV